MFGLVDIISFNYENSWKETNTFLQSINFSNFNEIFF